MMSARAPLFALLVTLLVGTLVCAAAQAKPLDTYIEEAQSLYRAGDPVKAYAAMEAALAEYPDNATVYAYLGLYKGAQAGTATNIMEAGSLSNESFVLLDRAIAIDSLDAPARFYRGLMGVRVPEFLGKLDAGVRDLEWVLVINDRFPGEVSGDMLVTAYDFLGEGYQKQGNTGGAETAWRKVIELAPGSDLARAEEARLAELSGATRAQPQAAVPTAPSRPQTPATPADVAALMDEGRALMDARDYPAAEKIFREVITLDSTNAIAYRLAGTAMSLADQGYDSQIAEDTTQRTNLVFEAMRLLDKSVALDPNDMETRLLRGLMGVQFPFFVNKLDTGIQDLQMVIASGSSTSMKAQAKYWLGFGYQKKGMTYWTQVVNENLDDEAVALALNSMPPTVDHFNRLSHPGPVVVVEFLLGFYDDLPPQTAVWVETDKGALVKTLYISGFSGHAKQVQVVLPVYAAETGYADVDAVTGASIDVGNHIYTWDLKDSAGKQVAPGRYTVKVEVTHWPTMKYQLAEIELEVGGGRTEQVVEEGDYIPYLRVQYIP
jgi:tetratricopeptide (TPR) repeat protein